MVVAVAAIAGRDGGNGAWWWISIFCAASKFCFGNKISTFDDVLAVNLLEENIMPLCDNKTFAYFIVKTHSTTYTRTHTEILHYFYHQSQKGGKIGKKKIYQISNLFVELLKLLILLFISCRCDFNHFEWQPCIVSLSLSYYCEGIAHHFYAIFHSLITQWEFKTCALSLFIQFTAQCF